LTAEDQSNKVLRNLSRADIEVKLTLLKSYIQETTTEVTKAYEKMKEKMNRENKQKKKEEKPKEKDEKTAEKPVATKKSILKKSTKF
jgi:hypothetical protein